MIKRKLSLKFIALIMVTVLSVCTLPIVTLMSAEMKASAVAADVSVGMTPVKFQLSNDYSQNANETSVRFISAIDKLERYRKVGWLFSTINTNPEIGGLNVSQRSCNTVYTSILANNQIVTATDIYAGSSYAKYISIFEITEIPSTEFSTLIYVRPYAELTDGGIVYGEVTFCSVDTLAGRLNQDNSSDTSSSTSSNGVQYNSDNSGWSEWV